MKFNSVLAFLLLLTFSASQARMHDTASLNFLGYEIGEKFVVLNYEIPFDGMVEIRIFSEGTNLIWQNQYVNPRGTNSIKLKSSAFQDNTEYTVQLNYKKDVFRKNFTIKR